MTTNRWMRIREERGVSLLEILIGLSIFSIALLALAAAGGVAARQVHAGRTDMHRWAAVQQQVETIIAQGSTNVVDGSAMVQGYPMNWTVSGSINSVRERRISSPRIAFSRCF